MSEKEILNLSETLEALGGISRTTLWRLMDKGEIKPLPRPSVLKKRKELLFRRSDVEALLKKEPAPSAA